MEENNLDKSLLLEGDASEAVVSSMQKTAQILDKQPKNDRRFYCDALDDDNVNEVVKDVVPHVVTFLGFAEFGKSTFVGSLYHYLMTNGVIGDFTFYDSDTFSGFERRTYIRNAKLNGVKRSLRTTEIDGYYLSLHFERDRHHFQLVLSDRSGETYGKKYVSDATSISADKGLKNSRHLVFFIDSTVFVDREKRLDFNSLFNKLLSRMKSSEIFKKEMVIDVVFNKIDDIQNKDENIQAEFKSRAETFKKKLELESGFKINRVFEISSLKIDDNELLIDFFKYLVSCCDCKKTYNPKVDWVAELLKS